MRPREGRRADLASAIALLALALFLFWPLLFHVDHLVPFHVLAGDPSLAGIDTHADRPDWRTYDLSPVTTFYAEKALAARELRHGELPLWNPYNGLGFPLLADGQSQPLSPFFFPFLAVPTPWVYSICILLQLLFGGWGMDRLLSEWGCGIWPRVAGAAAFAFNPYTLKYLVYSDVWAYVWIPWMLVGAERLASRKKWGFTLLAATTAMAGFCGHMEVAFMASAAAFLYLILRSLALGTITGARIGKFSLVPLTAFLLSAVWILPFLQWVHLSWSPRMGGFHPYPYPFGALFTSGSELLWLPFMLALAFAGLSAGSRAWSLAPVLVYAGLVMFPSFHEIQSVLSLGFMSGRYARSLAWFVVVAWASLGLQALLEQNTKGLWKWGGFLLQGLWLMAALFSNGLSKATAGRVPLTGAPAVFSPAVLGMVAAGLVLWFLPWGRRGLNRSLAGPLVAGVLLAGLVLLPSGLDVLWNRSDPSPAPALRREGPREGGRTWLPQKDGYELMSPNLSAMFSIRDVRYCMPLTPRRLLPLAGSPRLGFMGFDGWHPRRLDMAGVTVAYRFGPGASRLGAYKNPEALPRGVWVERAQPVSDVGTATTLALRGEAWRRTAFVEGLIHKKNEEKDSKDEATALRITLVRDGAETSIWKVGSSAAGWFVLRDLYWPGWVATVDGRRTRIYPADGAFRAIALSPGTHEIVFRYRPAVVLVGAILSLIAWGILIGIGVVKKGTGHGLDG